MSDNGSNDAPKVDAVGSSGETRQTSETVCFGVQI